MQIIDKIVKTQKGPLSGNVLWLDSKEKKLKFLSEDGWKALNDEAADVSEVAQELASLSTEVSSLQDTVNNASSLLPVVTISGKGTEKTKTVEYPDPLYLEGNIISDSINGTRGDLALGLRYDSAATSCLYYSAATNAASLLLKPQYYGEGFVHNNECYIKIGDVNHTLKQGVYFHWGNTGVWASELYAAKNEVNTLLAKSTTIEKLSDDASLSDVVAKCNEVITALGSLNLIAVSEVVTE